MKGLIGVLHLAPLPGDPRHDGSSGFAAVEHAALEGAQALAEGGVDAILVENFGSVPFPKGTAAQPSEPHVVAFLAIVGRAVRDATGRPVGINCLRNDARAAIGIAAASRLDFVRVNVHTGAYVTDQGLIEGDACRSLRYKKGIGASRVAILADVLVKHAIPLAPTDAGVATRDLIERGLADAVIVTGARTGEAVSRERLAAVRAAAGGTPVLIGSGLTPANAELATEAHGAIVGTWFEQDGKIRAARVRELADVLRGRFLEART